ncbi:uncharacterized protein LOC144163714 [Haemaphysalis longicornis]
MGHECPVSDDRRFQQYVSRWDQALLESHIGNDAPVEEPIAGKAITDYLYVYTAFLTNTTTWGVHILGLLCRRSAAAACAVPELDLTVQRRLNFASSSTTAELVGLHLAADALAGRPDIKQAVLLCDSRAALQRLQKPSKHGPLVQRLAKKLRDLQQGDRRISLHWVPAHVRLEGNECADSLAKAAHSGDTPLFEGAARGDEARHWIAKHAQQRHQTPSHADGGKRGRIPSRTFCRADGSLLLQLRTRCAPSTARRFFFGQADSPDCQHCGELGNTEHALLRCSRYSKERAKMIRRYAGAALTALLHFLHATDLATLP